MKFYEKMGVKPLINASETYTSLGGSLMDPRTIRAMQEAGQSFIDLEELLTAVCNKAAVLTNNEAAFVTTGAAGGVILSAASCICGLDIEKLDKLPHVEEFERNEIIVFDGAFLQIVPYWKLIGLTGAKIVRVEPTIEGILEAINEHTAAVFLFPSSLYEADLPKCEEVIPILKKKGVTVVVDAAAQLPPRSNLWYYTRELGADLAVYSGGKHIQGPQSTGLIVGRSDLIQACRLASSPNARIGRAFKTGKEELAGFITALEIFCTETDRERFARQEEKLNELKTLLLKEVSDLQLEYRTEGRLGTYQPLLLLSLPKGMTAKACNEYTRAWETPIDVGVYPKEFHMPENVLFLNAYNLKNNEVPIVAKALIAFINQS